MDPGTRLAELIIRNTIHCYTQNINVLGLFKADFINGFHCKYMGTNDPHFTPRA